MGRMPIPRTHPKHSILSKKSKSGSRKRNVSSCRFFVYILAFTTLFLGNFHTNSTLFLGNFRTNTTLFLANFRTNTTLFLANLLIK